MVLKSTVYTVIMFLINFGAKFKTSYRSTGTHLTKQVCNIQVERIQ